MNTCTLKLIWLVSVHQNITFISSHGPVFLYKLWCIDSYPLDWSRWTAAGKEKAGCWEIYCCTTVRNGGLALNQLCVNVLMLQSKKIIVFFAIQDYLQHLFFIMYVKQIWSNDCLKQMSLASCFVMLCNIIIMYQYNRSILHQSVQINIMFYGFYLE